MEVLIFSLLGGVVSLFAAMLLINNRKTAGLLANYATPFAAGVLLAAAFTDLLPEALHESTSDPRGVLMWGLFGVLAFFILERFLRFFHHHHEHGKEKASNALVITGDTLHNALDGIAIGAAFLIDTPTGIVAALAVAAHEIPQEIGDFSILLKNGMEKSKVILVNILSALATTATALITFALGDSESFPIAALLAITAGFFIYIAASDIIPEIHEKSAKNRKDIRPWLLIAGAVFIMVVSPIAHRYIDPAHDHEETTSESHAHEDYMLAETDEVPEITFHVTGSLDKGVTVHLKTEHFTITPENEGKEHVAGQGHAHLYVDGVKLTRLYGEYTFVPADLLPENVTEFAVSLSTNDHKELHKPNGDPVMATAQLESTSDTHDDSEMHEDEKTDNHAH